MKKILFLLLSFVVFACATQRQSERQISDSGISQMISETIRYEFSQFSGTLDTEKNENTEIQIHIMRYDTSQPADPATGKPPVQEEETRTIGKQATEKTKSEQEGKSGAATSEKQTKEVQINSEIDEKNTLATDVAGGGNFIWVWIVAVALVCLLAYLFIKK
jgi:hypothetical protein